MISRTAIVLAMICSTTTSFMPQNSKLVKQSRYIKKESLPLLWGPFGKTEEEEIEEPSVDTLPEAEEPEKKGISFQGLFDLMAMGVGAPNLGKFTGVDEETGALQFELEVNNFESKVTGKKYTSYDNRDNTYFEEGYVDEDADVMGKMSRFFGGGKKEENLEE
uniref:Uncharacterized protein n=1 Tax=Octactis speculum TaxID=3111310 RepID=A0A7S2CPV8_9STRA|mmetsp:Transcript_38589/g.52304  ORF Transcript_38589/g.52304 Transcript_38589/m.52304 type:complete len:163 (+) Transcript_38589:29-517(+)